MEKPLDSNALTEYINSLSLLDELEEVMQCFNTNNPNIHMELKYKSVVEIKNIPPSFSIMYKDKRSAIKEIFKIKFLNELRISGSQSKKIADSDDGISWNISHNINNNSDFKKDIPTSKVINVLKNMLSIELPRDNQPPLQDHEMEIY